MIRQMLHFFGRPRLIRQLATFDNTGLRFPAQEETARVRQNRISGAAGPRLPASFDIRLPVRGARRRIWLCRLGRCFGGRALAECDRHTARNKD